MASDQAADSPKKLLRPIRVKRGLLALLCLGIGLALAQLPVLWAGLGLVVCAALAATLIDPLAGLGVTLLFATFKPLTDYFVPDLPLDIGQLALIVTLGAWLMRQAARHEIRIPRSPLTAPLLAFIGIASLGLPEALSIGYALKEVVKWLQIVIVMWLVLAEAGQRRWRVVIGMVLSAAIVEALIGVWQFGLRGDGPKHFLILNDQFYRAYGTFEQPNPYGGFIGLVLPIAIALALAGLGRWLSRVKDGWRRCSAQKLPSLLLNRSAIRAVGLLVIAGLLGSALIMSWSRGAWLGAGAALAVIVAAWPRRWWIGFAMLAAAILAVTLGMTLRLLPASVASRLTDFSSEITTNFDARGVDITPENYAVIERLAHWQAAEDMARYHLLFGVGLGNYEPVYPGYQLLNWPDPLGHAHNIYLNMLAETGIIGFLAYAVLWVAVFGLTWKASRANDGWRRAIAIGLLGAWTHLTVHNLVDNLYVANIHLHIAALFGVLCILIEEGSRKPVERKP